MSQKSYRDDQTKLYLIPTPVGNMDDITYRAVKTLKLVDILLCEDTRVTSDLLRHFDLKKRLIACHDHNEDQIGCLVQKYLDEGKNVGLVTDRGTPIISDPGYKVVEYITKMGYDVVGLPGATAFVPALIMSGIEPEPFLFYGFLNSKQSQRIKELQTLKKISSTIIFYEAPHRIENMLKSLLDEFGDRRISLSREISKMYEEIYRGTISDVLEEIKDGIKGEIVVVVSGNKEIEDFSSMTIKEHVDLYIEDGINSKEAIKKVAKERNIPKSVVYKEYHIGSE